jgi:hypothetical protein
MCVILGLTSQGVTITLNAVEVGTNWQGPSYSMTTLSL